MQLVEKVIYFGVSITEEDYPPVDIYETEEAYFFVFDIAGVGKENIILKICDDNLMLMGTRPKAGCSEPVVWHCRELPFADFQRTLPLPEDIDPSGADASMCNGVLEVRIPKKTRRVHKIEIKGE